jgi:hypothetical protein
MSRHHLAILIVAGAAALGAPVIVSLGASDPGSPALTLQTFLRAAASGDARTACAQLSPSAQRDMIQGASCEQGITNGAGFYGSIIGQLRVSGLRTTRGTATATTNLSGRPTATVQLKNTGGKWLIVHEQRVAAAATAGASSSGPSQARVETVASCLDKSFRAVENAGLDSTGGVSHVALSVDVDGYSAAEVDVFATALAAVSGYRGIKTYNRSLTTNVAGGSVIVYTRTIATAQQRRIEACG